MTKNKMPDGDSSLTSKVDAAFRRAAKKVIQKARETGTSIVIWEDGQVKEIPGDEFDETALGLDDTGVTSACLKPVPNVEKLWLTNTKVDDAALDQLKRLTKLTLLEIKGTKLSDASVAALRAALPRCRIVK